MNRHNYLETCNVLCGLMTLLREIAADRKYHVAVSGRLVATLHRSRVVPPPRLLHRMEPISR